VVPERPTAAWTGKVEPCDQRGPWPESPVGAACLGVGRWGWRRAEDGGVDLVQEVHVVQ
jgi:hypothetical protein